MANIVAYRITQHMIESILNQHISRLFPDDNDKLALVIDALGLASHGRDWDRVDGSGERRDGFV